MAPVYALNLFDLAENDDYRAYSKRSRDAVERHGGYLWWAYDKLEDLRPLLARPTSPGRGEA